MSRHGALPEGITIEQIAASIEAITTARISLRGMVRMKGRDIPADGDGLVDFSRSIVFTSLAVNGRKIEKLLVGHDQFERLPESRQQSTGKVWLWKPGPHDGYWHRMITAMPHIASCTGSSQESLAGEPVHRLSFLLKPRRPSLLTRLIKQQDPSVDELYARLRAHGRDRVFVDVWLASDHTLRKVREHSTAQEVALLAGDTASAASTADFWDFGVSVDLAAPPTDQVLGYPAERLLLRLHHVPAVRLADICGRRADSARRTIGAGAPAWSDAVARLGDVAADGERSTTAAHTYRARVQGAIGSRWTSVRARLPRPW